MDIPDLPQCDQRGRVLPSGNCFCRHAAVAGGAKSSPVPVQQCITCPYPVDGSDPAGGKRRPAPVAVSVSSGSKLRLKLGDRVQSALSTVGITQARVTTWLGNCGGCPDRQERLNQLSDWAEDTALLALGQAKRRLLTLIGQHDEARQIIDPPADIRPRNSDEQAAYEQWLKEWHR